MTTTHDHTAALDAIAHATMTPPLVAAHELLELGYHVIPLAPRAKMPPKGLTGWSQRTQPPTHAEIEGWLSKWPDGNVGVRVGAALGVMVLDLDGQRAVELARIAGIPSNAPTVLTGHGMHVYMHCPQWLNTSYTGINALMHLDADSNGTSARVELKASGYVVAVGSTHPNGTTYTPVVDMCQVNKLPEPPQWVMQLIRGKQAHPKPTAPSKHPTTQPIPETNPPRTPTTSPPPNISPALLREIAQRLGVKEYNARGWSNNVTCPFHDDQHASAVWHKDGALYCHAGCKPQNGKRSFSAFQTAQQLGIPTPTKTGPLEHPGSPEAQFFSFAPPSRGECALPPAPPTDVANATCSVISFAFGSPLTPPHRRENQGGRGIFSRLVPPIKLYLYPNPDQKRKNSKRGRKASQYVLELAEIATFHYAALTAEELSSRRKYNAAVYSMFEAGMYKRADLAGAVGVMPATARRYDKVAGVVAEKNVKREKRGPEHEGELPLRVEDAPPGVWLESTAGRSFAHTRDGFRRALADSVKYSGQAIVYKCRRLPNTYTPPERNADAPGLPVEVRQWFLRQKLGAVARVLDALLLGGIRPGEPFTAAEAVKICARYGIGETATRNALRKAAAMAKGGSDVQM